MFYLQSVICVGQRCPPTAWLRHAVITWHTWYTNIMSAHPTTYFGLDIKVFLYFRQATCWSWREKLYIGGCQTLDPRSVRLLLTHRILQCFKNFIFMKKQITFGSETKLEKSILLSHSKVTSAGYNRCLTITKTFTWHAIQKGNHVSETHRPPTSQSNNGTYGCHGDVIHIHVNENIKNILTNNKSKCARNYFILDN